MENLDGVQIEQEEDIATLNWGPYSRKVNLNNEKDDAIISSIESIQATRSEEGRLDSAKRAVSKGIEDVEPLQGEDIQTIN